ncbi:DUF4175 family protein [Flavobacterium sp. GT3R68]|uniref:DUF4175 family protein n=1 Tax=Flavobacterium sp. GT3R68 TaxID=2594437 RepID=UPI000F882500|nr:DUF4175 family protein [Flavobacterium sp. GT3R68]RTY95880.1 hypothetical protein EKL32_04335 [Flavobacterium sp. GSN2]TRW93652.1 hypothetical protein FNW07_01725 [Flavobacterium sp. GT3R68]
MENKTLIYHKLEAFIKKFYTNELLRGLIFFIGLGLLYLLFTLFVEYFLWLKPMGRTILFWTFIMVELFLLGRFILFPVSKLFKLQKGINYGEASAIIGNHFTEVSDKLTNFLQLSSDSNQSELLLASIEQKAKALQPIPFSNAINFDSNRKYLPLAIIPILFFAFFYISGNSKIISQSMNRVVHFKEQFLPPAPFQFVVLNPSLQTEQNKDFILKIKTQGKIVPENAMIFIGDESYFMESNAAGEFQFKIEKPTANLSFHVEANDVSSSEYELAVITVPSIANFQMLLHFPSYLNKKPELIRGTGNAIVPEGTRVTWEMNTLATQKVEWTDLKTNIPFSKQDNVFTLSKNISQNTEYQILTSNEKVKNFEKLNYQLSIIKDQFPSINVGTAPDSLKVAKNYVLGTISDDYGLYKLQVVYYPKNKPENAKRGTIRSRKDVYDQFVFAFPSALPVEQGVSYDYYFEVFDNDALHHFKSTKSSVFSNRIATDQEKEDQVLQQQNDNINSLEKSLKNQDKQISEMEKLQKTGKEKDNLEFKDQQKMNDFIKRQKQQDEMMKEFSKKMEENLDKVKTDKKDEFKEELQKRLEKADKDLEKNQKLLDELKELTDKIKNEELLEKLEKFKQNSKNQTKNLEQLVELTKKYYVEKKAEQLADKLDKLSEKQEDLSNKEKENNTDKQSEINKEFDKIQEDLKELDKENKELKSPLDIPKDEEKEKSIDEDLKKASDELQKQNQSKAKPKQKSASKKMKEMAAKMSESMAGGEMEQLEEDVKMLRQILDNLLAFSFSQEDLMGEFKGLRRGSPSYNKHLKIQQDLKQQFKHVDDSLFALSLRNPKIAEDITKEIGNVHYNLDKALESLAETQIPKGLSHQQYTISSANKLADFLSDVLNGMQMQMQMSGTGSGGKPKPGQGQGMQLPDIIKKQEGLGQKISDGMKKGEKPGEGKEGDKGEKGKSGKTGKSGSDGNEGENGEDGEGTAGEIMKIYQEQKQLREALQKALEKEGLGGSGQNAVEQMKQLEKQLLNKGFNNETLQKMLNLKYELLKLDKAVQQQGEEKNRQSETNKKEFNNQSNALPAALQDYLNSIEILNRQSLPLRQNYNQKVQKYFRKDD